MRGRLLIGISVLMWSFTVTLSGCSIDEGQHLSESYTESAYSTGAVVSDDSAGITETPDDNSNDGYITIGSDHEDNVIKSYNQEIEETGTIINGMEEISDLYLTAMDNENLYFSSTSLPRTISSVNRSDHEMIDIMTYNLDVEWGSNNKNTYCGNYVVFPCSGSPDDEYVTIRAFVGKTDGQTKCILEQPTGAISVCAAELNANEMTFLCTGEKKGIFNIYKYNFNEDQAKHIYSEELDTLSQNSNPLIACYNEDIYFVFKLNEDKNIFCVKRINADGEECDVMHLELPGYFDTTMREFTVTENNILIRFEPSDEFGYFRTVIVNKKTNKIFSDSGDNGLGVRYNDNLIDGRYIIFRAGSKSNSSHPMICVFDDLNSEFHFLKFTEIDTEKIINIVADYRGDVVFWVDDSGTDTMLLFEDLCSLITNS